MRTWTKASLDDAIADFLWRQWGQLGVAGVVQGTDRRAIDPEALLLFTLLFAPREPRLFDEVLDWLRVNGRLISVSRSHTIARERRERRLIDAALAWAGTHESKLQLRAGRHPDAPPTPEPLADLYVREADPTFAAWGFVWPRTEPSGGSRRVDPTRAIALAFRLRLLMGVGARAEIVRFLLTISGKPSTTSEIAYACAFGRRNVADALSELAEAGAIETGPKTRGQTYSLDTDRWRPLLAIAHQGIPRYVDWIRLLGVVWRIVQWFDEDARSERTDYIRASTARALISDVEGDLISVGVKDPRRHEAQGTGHLERFQGVAEAVMERLARGSL